MKIAIMGVGKLGRRVLEALLDGDDEVTIVDTNPKRLNNFSAAFDVPAVLGDARRVEVLQNMKIHEYDFLLACTSSDDANIIAATNAKALGCPKVVARLSSPAFMHQHKFFCKTYNIDSIVNPDLLIAGEMYRSLIDKYSLQNGIYTTKKIAMVEMEARKLPDIINKPLNQFREIMPNNLVVGISRHGKVIIPHGNDVVQPDDVIFIVGERKEALTSLAKHAIKKRKGARKIMIVGGGRTGYFLASRLSEYGSFVKIIEQNPQRADQLNEEFKNVVVINGNGTDVDLLAEEGLDQMDAFVSVTGMDEENLLLALTAKNHGVEDVISKVSHDNFDELSSRLGIDIIMNPMDICASSILRIISGSERILSEVMLQGQAELLELYVNGSMKIANKKICELNFPDYAIIAAINRGSQTIIPTGNEVIKPGDHVLVVCLLSHIGYIQKLMMPIGHVSLIEKITQRITVTK